MADGFMTVAEYAAFRKQRGLSGGTRVAVYKAIKTGRIRAYEGGLVNAAEADRMWVALTMFRMPPMRMY